MTERSDARSLAPGEALSPAGITADELIAAHGGDAHAAVIMLLDLVDALRRENATLAGAVSHGFIRLALAPSP